MCKNHQLCLCVQSLGNFNAHQLYSFSVWGRHSTVLQIVWQDQSWWAVTQAGSSGSRAHMWLPEPFRICSDTFSSLCWCSHGWRRSGTWKSLRNVEMFTEKPCLRMKITDDKCCFPLNCPWRGGEGPLQSLAGGTEATDLQEFPNLLRKCGCSSRC